jgi:hypothetical protein
MAKLSLRKLPQKADHKTFLGSVGKVRMGSRFIPFSFMILAPTAPALLAIRPQPGLDPTPQKEDPAPDLMVFIKICV